MARDGACEFAFSPDNTALGFDVLGDKLFVSQGNVGQSTSCISVWDWRAEELLYKVELVAGSVRRYVASVAFSASGERLFVLVREGSDEGALHVFDVA